ncbi:MAG: tRNA pseudouridine(13) synthase TruD [Candidatus Korarchaeota archaeon]|nr:tRNA pseudouridine(13) synthase TruD [Candidatus Korarchaeota archaeon]
MANPPELDVRTGMLAYARPDWDPLPGRLRERLPDFLVDEVWRGASALMAAASLESPEVQEGPHAVFSVIKVGLTTEEAAGLLARALRIPTSRVSYAGLKDRRSVSAQFMSAPLGRPPEVVRARKLMARFVCRSTEPVYRGSNDLNRFTLRVRETEPRELSRRLMELSRGFPNFFSYQRFGDRPPLNHEIGLLVLRREFDRAARLLAGKGGRGYESRVADALDRGGGGLEALRAIPRGALEMMLHSYQAYVFNLTLSGRLRDGRLSPRPGDRVVPLSGGGESLALPLPGSDPDAYRGSAGEETLEVLRRDGLSPESFRLPELGLDLAGGVRPAWVPARSLRLWKRGDSLLASFALDRGSYATSLMREALLPRDPSSQGFL